MSRTNYVTTAEQARGTVSKDATPLVQPTSNLLVTPRPNYAMSYQPLTATETDNEETDSDDNNDLDDQGDDDDYKEWNLVVAAAKMDARARRGFMRACLPQCVHRDRATILKHKADKKLCMVLRADKCRDDLDQGCLLNLMQVYGEYTRKLEQGTHYSHVSIYVEVTADICAVAVPVLIPFAQQYENVAIPVDEQGTNVINVGTCLAIVAVLCSLIATVLSAFQKTSKYSEFSVSDIQEAQTLEKALETFLAKTCGVLDPDTQEEYDTYTAYQSFVTRYQTIRAASFDAMKASLVAPSLTTTAGPVRKAKGKKKDKRGKRAPGTETAS